MKVQRMMDCCLSRPLYSPGNHLRSKQICRGKLPSYVQRKDSEFRGEKKQQPVIPCALIVYSLRFLEGQLLLNELYVKYAG